MEVEVEEEGNEEEGERDGETPRGATVEVIYVGGGLHPPPPPRRRTRNSWYSPQNVRTSCCRKSMETSCTKTTGRIWKGKSRTTLYGSIIGAGSLHSQQAGTPCPL